MSKSKYAGQGYDSIRHITELPIKSRRQLAIGRGGSRIKPRKFHLNTAEVDQYRAEYKETGRIPIPFNVGGYHFTVAALIALGLDQKHKLATVMEKFRELANDPSTKDDEGATYWKRFKNRDPKGMPDTSLDWQDRFEQNIRVLQRFGGVTPYGLKLCEVGTKVCRFKGLVIDLLKDGNGEVYVRLNTQANRPVNELKVRNSTKTTSGRTQRTKRPRKANKPAVATTAAQTVVAPAPDASQTAPAVQPAVASA